MRKPKVYRDFNDFKTLCKDFRVQQNRIVVSLSVLVSGLHSEPIIELMLTSLPGCLISGNKGPMSYFILCSIPTFGE